MLAQTHEHFVLVVPGYLFCILDISHATKSRILYFKKCDEGENIVFMKTSELYDPFVWTKSASNTLLLVHTIIGWIFLKTTKSGKRLVR